VTTLDSRFTLPLYSLAEAAHYLGVSTSTFSTWARGYERHPAGRRAVRGAPIVTAFPAPRPGDACVPFIGLTEGLVLAAIRKTGVPLQRIRPALDALKKEFGLEHVLASRRLYTDGAEVLFDMSERDSSLQDASQARRLIVARNNQYVFNEVIDSYLRRIEYGSDDYATRIGLPGYETTRVLVDPQRGFGHPIFAASGARVEDALSLFRAGESLETVAAEFGVPIEDVEAALRVETRAAA
jgi:uncharacterized protein (DUF433 family)